MKRKSSKTLALIFSRPASGCIKWREIEALLVDLGAKVSEREGSRIGVVYLARCAYSIAQTLRRIRTKVRLSRFASG